MEAKGVQMEPIWEPNRDKIRTKFEHRCGMRFGIESKSGVDLGVHSGGLPLAEVLGLLKPTIVRVREGQKMKVK